MNKVFGVVDANSAYWTTEGEQDYDNDGIRIAAPGEAVEDASD